MVWYTYSQTNEPSIFEMKLLKFYWIFTQNTKKSFEHPSATSFTD